MNLLGAKNNLHAFGNFSFVPNLLFCLAWKIFEQFVSVTPEKLCEFKILKKSI